MKSLKEVMPDDLLITLDSSLVGNLTGGFLTGAGAVFSCLGGAIVMDGCRYRRALELFVCFLC